MRRLALRNDRFIDRGPRTESRQRSFRCIPDASELDTVTLRSRSRLATAGLKRAAGSHVPPHPCGHARCIDQRAKRSASSRVQGYPLPSSRRIDVSGHPVGPRTSAPSWPPPSAKAHEVVAEAINRERSPRDISCTYRATKSHKMDQPPRETMDHLLENRRGADKIHPSGRFL